MYLTNGSSVNHSYCYGVYKSTVALWDTVVHCYLQVGNTEYRCSKMPVDESVQPELRGLANIVSIACHNV